MGHPSLYPSMPLEMPLLSWFSSHTPVGLQRQSPAPLLPTGVMEGFQRPKIPPRGWQTILQKLSAALAWSLEELYVTS